MWNEDASSVGSMPLSNTGREANPRARRCRGGCRGRTLVTAASAPTLGFGLVGGFALALEGRVTMPAGAGAQRRQRASLGDEGDTSQTYL
jgi:hypothetical protein